VAARDRRARVHDLNIAVRIWNPRDGVIDVPWLSPLIEGAMLVVLLTSNPASPAERRHLRMLSLVLVGLLVIASLWATSLLIRDLIEGEGNADSPGHLLAPGALVWLGTTSRSASCTG
jgi:hypothetical protein